jgi:uronate dehydrogenase
MKTILLTGAAGNVASLLRPLMRPDYRLRLSDLRTIGDVAAGEQSAPADLADLSAVERVVMGADGIVHLGGFSVEGAWPTILEANIVGTYNLFEAARRAGVKRIVFASSNHVMGFYRRDETVGIDAAVRPDTRYGLSKAVGEALGSLYAYKYDMEVMSIRIGNVADRPLDVRRLAIWISPRDLYQLIRIGLERPGIRHEIVYGMSDNARAWWDNANARRLGYDPQDRAEDHAAEVLAAEPPKRPGDPAETYQGGGFVSIETGGDPRKPHLG